MEAIMRMLPAAAAAMVGLSCASTYLPRAHGRLALAQRGSELVAYRDGQEISIGYMAGDLEEAVRGSARAEEMARSAHARMRNGVWLGVAGTLGLLGTGVFAQAMSAVDGPNPYAKAEAGVLLVSTVLAFVGGGLFDSGRARIYDAVNIYNDDVSGTSP
jgi:hypothetical protein